MSLIGKRVRLTGDFTPIYPGDWTPSQYFIQREPDLVFMPTEVKDGKGLKFRENTIPAFILKEM